MNGLDHIGFDPAVVFALVMAVFILSLQVLLCFKAKRLLVKLLPVMLLAVSAAVFCVLSASMGGWDSLGYLYFALLSFGLLLGCGLVWLILAAAGKPGR